jgi:hypothetical protein
MIAKMVLKGVCCAKEASATAFAPAPWQPFLEPRPLQLSVIPPYFQASRQHVRQAE